MATTNASLAAVTSMIVVRARNDGADGAQMEQLTAIFSGEMGGISKFLVP